MNHEIYEVISNKKTERPGKEIKINGEKTLNKNITVKFGTIDNKNAPKSVYIQIGFWVNIKNRDIDDDCFGKNISKKFEREVKKIYKNDLHEMLKDNELFPFYN